jgi:hypothetical protein
MAVTISRRSLPENPLSRPATSRLAASRLTSHSHGPGRVSSKSFTSKTRRRSAEPKMPKFDRCASPHACTASPDTGCRPGRRPSAAPHRGRNVNGDTIIRPHRTGTPSGTRAFACSASRLSGSGRPGGGSNTAWLSRGTWARAALPRSARSAGVSRPSPESSWYRNEPAGRSPRRQHTHPRLLYSRASMACASRSRSM